MLPNYNIFKKNFSFRNVEGRQEFKGSFEMTPAKTGNREIVCYFNSKQISAVTGSCFIDIE